MRMCTLHRNIKKLTSKHIGGSDTSADHRSARTVHAGVRSLRAAQSEFHDAVALRGINHAGCLCCDKTLVVDDRQNSSFHELRFHDRRDHLDQRLARENNSTLRDSVDIAAEAEGAEVIEKICVKDMQPSQISNIFL